jgi:RHS repeat-associated protein
MPVEIISFSKDSVTTNYVYDGTNLVAEMRPNASGTLVVVTSYLLGAQGIEAKIDETAQTEAYYKIDPTTGARLFDANNNLIVAYRGVTSWYVYDGHGNVVGTVNGVTGVFTANPTLDVYGVPRATGAPGTKQGYCGSLGHVTDDTGLVYMRARYYDPGTGRFVSEDPGAHGHNWYVYAGDNPVTMSDRTGKGTESNAINTVFSGEIGLLIMDILGDPQRGIPFLIAFLRAELGDNTLNFTFGESPGVGGDVMMTIKSSSEDFIDTLEGDDIYEIIGEEEEAITGIEMECKNLCTLLEGASAADAAEGEAVTVTAELL